MASDDTTPPAPTPLPERRPEPYVQRRDAAAAATPVPDAPYEPHPGIVSHPGTIIEVNAELSKLMPPVPNIDVAQVGDLSCLNSVKFRPSGDAAADAAAWRNFMRTVRGHMPCTKLLSVKGGIRGHEVVMAVLLRRIFDLCLDGTAADLIDPHGNGITTYYMLQDNYDSQGADQQVAFEGAIRRIDSISYTAFPSAASYNAEFNAAKQALAALDKPLDEASSKMYYLHGLGPARNNKVDLTMYIGIWRQSGESVDLMMRKLAGCARDAAATAAAGSRVAPRSALAAAADVGRGRLTRAEIAPALAALDLAHNRGDYDAAKEITGHGSRIVRAMSGGGQGRASTPTRSAGTSRPAAATAAPRADTGTPAPRPPPSRRRRRPPRRPRRSSRSRPRRTRAPPWPCSRPATCPSSRTASTPRPSTPATARGT